MADIMRVIQNLDADEYHARPELSFSQLKHMALSPKHFRYAVDNGTADRESFAFGRAVHTATLEPHLFAGMYLRQPDEIKVRRGKKWEEYLSRANESGYQVLRSKQFDDALSAADAIRSEPVAIEWLSNATMETSLVGTLHGVPVRCRIDMLSGDWVGVGELKTSAEIEPMAVERSIIRFDYLAQLAWYHDLAKIADGKNRQARMLVVEKTPPFDVIPFEFTAEDIDFGRRRYMSWLSLYSECVESGRWPGVANGQVMRFTLPEWAFDEAIKIGEVV